MNYSQALESLIQEIVYYGDSAERREKVHCSTLKTVQRISVIHTTSMRSF